MGHPYHQRGTSRAPQPRTARKRCVIEASCWVTFGEQGWVISRERRSIRSASPFQDLYLQPPEDANKHLDKWYFWATHSRIQPIIDVAKTIRAHQDGILRWFTSQINNGILEGINSLVQAAKAKARGYRSDRNFAIIIYLVAGKLDLSCQPT